MIMNTCVLLNTFIITSEVINMTKKNHEKLSLCLKAWGVKVQLCAYINFSFLTLLFYPPENEPPITYK